MMATVTRIHHPSCPWRHGGVPDGTPCLCPTTVGQAVGEPNPRPADDEFTAADGSTAASYALGFTEQMELAIALETGAAEVDRDPEATPGAGDFLRAMAHNLASDGRPMTVTIVVTRGGE